MIFSIVILIVMCAGSASRWTAYRERILPPRRYSIGNVRWWFPPFPIAGEFATARSLRLEVTGRILMNVGAALVFVNIIVTEWRRW